MVCAANKTRRVGMKQETIKTLLRLYRESFDTWSRQVKHVRREDPKISVEVTQDLTNGLETDYRAARNRLTKEMLIGVEAR